MPATNPAVTGLLAIVSTAVLLMTCAAVVAGGGKIETSTPAIGRPKAFTTGELVLPSVPLWAKSKCGASAAKVTRRKNSCRTPPHIRSFICLSLVPIVQVQFVRTVSAGLPDFDPPAPRDTRFGGARPRLAALPRSRIAPQVLQTATLG